MVRSSEQSIDAAHLALDDHSIDMWVNPQRRFDQLVDADRELPDKIRKRRILVLDESPADPHRGRRTDRSPTLESARSAKTRHAHEARPGSDPNAAQPRPHRGPGMSGKPQASLDGTIGTPGYPSDRSSTAAEPEDVPLPARIHRTASVAALSCRRCGDLLGGVLNRQAFTDGETRPCSEQRAHLPEGIEGRSVGDRDHPVGSQ